MDGGAVSISGRLDGFDAAGTGNKHGFHIHAVGSLGNQCSDASGHFNPANKNHGAPTATERSVCRMKQTWMLPVDEGSLYRGRW